MEYRGYTIDILTIGYLISQGTNRVALQDTYFPYAGETVEDKAKAHVDALIAQSEAVEQEQATIEQLQQQLLLSNQRLQDAEDALIELASLLMPIVEQPEEPIEEPIDDVEGEE